MNNMHTVFVYGTLQQGCSNHILLAGSTCLGPANHPGLFGRSTARPRSDSIGSKYRARKVPEELVSVWLDGQRCEAFIYL